MPAAGALVALSAGLLLFGCPSNEVAVVPVGAGQTVSFLVAIGSDGVRIEGPLFVDGAMRFDGLLGDGREVFHLQLPLADIRAIRPDLAADLSGLKLSLEAESCPAGRLTGASLRITIPSTFVLTRIDGAELRVASEEERTRFSTATLEVAIDGDRCRVPLGAFRPFGSEAENLRNETSDPNAEPLLWLVPLGTNRVVAASTNLVYLFERGAAFQRDAHHRTRGGLDDRHSIRSMVVDTDDSATPLVLVAAGQEEQPEPPRGSYTRLSVSELGLEPLPGAFLVEQALSGLAIDPTSRALLLMGQDVVYTATQSGGPLRAPVSITEVNRLRRAWVTGTVGGLPGLVIGTPYDAVLVGAVDPAGQLSYTKEFIVPLFELRALAVNAVNGELFAVSNVGRVARRLPDGSWTPLPFAVAAEPPRCGMPDACGHPSYAGPAPNAAHLEIRGVEYLVLVPPACERSLLAVRLADGCPSTLDVDTDARLESVAFDGQRLLVGGARGLVMEAEVLPN